MTWWLPLVLAFVLGALAVEWCLLRRRRQAQAHYERLWDEAQELISTRVHDPRRVASIDRVRQRQSAHQAFLDMICRSTAAALKSPRSVITLIDAQSQTFIAHHVEDGTDADLMAMEMPLSSTYCQYTIASAKTLVITNATGHPVLKDNPCTTELGVRAYLGSPVYSREGFPVGSLCVFDFEPRNWDRRDIATIESFAALVLL